MSTFLLVHGSWQAGWVWKHVRNRLEAAGHEVVTPDLPGHGLTPAPPAEIRLVHYLDCVCEQIARCGTPIIVVGHSSAGAVITAATELVPERIEALVYVAAVIPENGGRMGDAMDGQDPALLETFQWADDGRSARISENGARTFLYHRCPASDVEAAIPRLTAEPLGPFEDPIATSERWLRTPAYYVETLQDRCVRPHVQKAAQSRRAFAAVRSLDTDHSPFFSAPGPLSTILDTIARRE